MHCHRVISLACSLLCFFFFFFFNDTATTEIYTLSLHDALPICATLVGGAARDDQVVRVHVEVVLGVGHGRADGSGQRREQLQQDRKSTRLNSSHSQISYAVFCLKKKKK